MSIISIVYLEFIVKEKHDKDNLFMRLVSEANYGNFDSIQCQYCGDMCLSILLKDAYWGHRALNPEVNTLN